MVDVNNKLDELVEDISMVAEHQNNNGNRGRDRSIKDLLDLQKLKNEMSLQKERESGGSIFLEVCD